MSPNPVYFLQHLRDKGYHSRSDKHSNALAEAIIQDLFKYCHAIHQKAARGEIVYWLNFDVISGSSTWNSDLVIGPPELGAAQPARLSAGVPCSRPSEIQIAIELKAIMTEHRKAVKNRKRDLEAHHEHVHHFNDRAIAAGVFVINASETFQSPLRPGITVHRKPLDLVRHCISELRSVALRGDRRGMGWRRSAR